MLKRLLFGHSVRAMRRYRCDACKRIVWSRDRISGSKCGKDGCTGRFLRSRPGSVSGKDGAW